MSRIAVVYGLGGKWFDPAMGEAYLVRRLQAIGVDTGKSPYQHTDSQAVYDFLHGYRDFIALIGDSLGAIAVLQFARSLQPQPVDYIAGFQPSDHDPLASHDPKTGLMHAVVPDNCKRAHVVRDPYWIDTAGLGHATWTAADHNKTKLLVTEHRAAHPDDYGWSQDMIYNEVKSLLEKR